jgi:hypothetical protein
MILTDDRPGRLVDEVSLRVWMAAVTQRGTGEVSRHGRVSVPSESAGVHKMCNISSDRWPAHRWRPLARGDGASANTFSAAVQSPKQQSLCPSLQFYRMNQRLHCHSGQNCDML